MPWRSPEIRVATLWKSLLRQCPVVIVGRLHVLVSLSVGFRRSNAGQADPVSQHIEGDWRHARLVVCSTGGSAVRSYRADSRTNCLFDFGVVVGIRASLHHRDDQLEAKEGTDLFVFTAWIFFVLCQRGDGGTFG